tara:strand:+ start:741 stop:953 length:213 start_codon:yes stop_codon:yes gene_type:complete
MWIGIMILCGSLHAESCTIITTRELFPSMEMCFQSAREKAKQAVEFPNVYRAKPFCQVIPGTLKPPSEET